MTEDVSREIADWLSPAVVSISENELASRVQSVLALAGSGPIRNLIPLAFGVPTAEGTEAVEAALEASDATYVPGKSTTLLACVAGAAAMLVMRKGGTTGVLAAHLVESADFLHLSERVPGLVTQAQATIDEASRRSRERGAAGASPLKRLPAEEETPPLQLAATLNDVMKRMDAVTSVLERRIAQLDEETDVLWWGRSSHSFAADAAWTDYSSEARGLQAGIELHSLLKFDPPFRGALSVLRDIAGDSDANLELSEIGVLASGTVLADNGIYPLLPISSAANHAREYEGKKGVIGAMLKKAGIDPKTSVKVRDIAPQVMRELQIGRSS